MNTIGYFFPTNAHVQMALPDILKRYPGKFIPMTRTIHQEDGSRILVCVAGGNNLYRWGGIELTAAICHPDLTENEQLFLRSRIRLPVTKDA